MTPEYQSLQERLKQQVQEQHEQYQSWRDRVASRRALKRVSKAEAKAIKMKAVEKRARQRRHQKTARRRARRLWLRRWKQRWVLARTAVSGKLALAFQATNSMAHKILLKLRSIPMSIATLRKQLAKQRQRVRRWTMAARAATVRFHRAGRPQAFAVLALVFVIAMLVGIAQHWTPVWTISPLLALLSAMAIGPSRRGRLWPLARWKLMTPVAFTWTGLWLIALLVG
jgi:hypothetical protein